MQANRHFFRIVFFAAVLLMGGAALIWLPRLCVPLVVAYVIGLILEKFVPPLLRLKLNRNWAIVILFAVLCFILIFPITQIVPILGEEIQKLRYDWPKWEVTIKTLFASFTHGIYVRTGLAVDEHFVNLFLDFAKSSTHDLLLLIPNTLAIAFEWILITPLYLFFMLRDGRYFRFLFLRLVPNPIFERSYQLLHEFNKRLGDYIFAKFIEACIIGIIVTGGLLALKVQFAWILGITAAVASIVPYIGPILGAIPGLVIASIDAGSGTSFLPVAMLYLVANLIDLALVFPILVSKIVNLHPVVVMISVILGSQWMGILGMVVSIPVAVVIKLVFAEICKELYSNSSSSRAYPNS